MWPHPSDPLQSAHVIAGNVQQGPRTGLSARQGSVAGQPLATEVLVGTGSAKMSVGFKAPQWPELLRLDHPYTGSLLRGGRASFSPLGSKDSHAPSEGTFDS